MKGEKEMKNKWFWILISNIFLILFLISCGGKSKSGDENLALQATMQAQQATIIALQAAPTQAAGAVAVEPAAENQLEVEDLQGLADKATMEAQQIIIDALQADKQATEEVIQAAQQESGQATEMAPVVNPGGSEIIFNTNFESDEGFFTLDKKITIEKGSLYMGQFEKCSDFSLEIDRPIGCLSICTQCGIVSEYDERVEITYADGYLDKPWGLILPFNDMNDNNMIDREDYFLGLYYNAYPQPNNSFLVEHIPADYAGWLKPFRLQRHLRGKQDKPTIVRVIAWQEGHRIMIWMNDTLVAKIQNEEKIPGKNDEIYIGKRKEVSPSWEGMPNSGKIGFWVTERKIQIKYDNFNFSNKPEEPSDW